MFRQIPGFKLYSPIAIWAVISLMVMVFYFNPLASVGSRYQHPVVQETTDISEQARNSTLGVSQYL